MKIRLSNNGIRIRLSQPDLDSIKHGEPLAINLPIGTEDLVITFKSGEKPIEYAPQQLTIALPESTLLGFVESRETSLTYSLDFPNNRTLHLIVEKDYLG